MLEDKRGKVERLGFRHGIHMICCWNEIKKKVQFSLHHVLEDENSVRRRRVATDSEEGDSSSSRKRIGPTVTRTETTRGGRAAVTRCVKWRREKKKKIDRAGGKCQGQGCSFKNATLGFVQSFLKCANKPKGKWQAGNKSLKAQQRRFSATEW